ncbi:MAG: site-specific DNA-methyltransferase [Chloroflexota bacterium]
MPPNIRSELDVLLDKVQDEALRTALQTQIDRLRQRRSFGLVFEHHIPERVRLPQHPIRVGSQVVSRDADDSPTWEVVALDGREATLVPIRDVGGAYLPAGDQAAQIQTPVEELVVISDFGEPVLPGLRFLGSVERGGDKPYHVVINGENHHALDALRFTHAGKIDCIYIDPPYNSGARDWKYNNDYVDDNDAYRHSKWLAFMERRLKLAKDLLKPDDSALIVTIDENEVHRLGLLLAQTFPGVRAQMVTIVINAPGQARKHELARVEEYAFFLFFGSAEPHAATDDLLNERPSHDPSVVRWESLLRSGTNSRRADRPALFYPVFASREGRQIVAVGDSKPLGTDRSAWNQPEGTVAIWPLKIDGTEGNWRASPEYLRSLISGGFARLGDYRAEEGRGTIWYLGKAALKKIETGEIEVVGRDDAGAVQVRPASRGRSRTTTVKTVWNRASHHAGWHGSALVRALLPGRAFPFPKSLYAEEDAIRLAVKDKPNAVVLDFFAGSGTTAHAVMRLNRQDAGRRQCILITNNEVSEDEAALLRSQGQRPGDSAWEAVGIFEHITVPRVTAAITGRTPDGAPIVGDYRFTDESPMADGFEENAAFAELRYLDPDDIELGLSLGDVSPLLWLRAGAKGPIANGLAGDGTRLPFTWTDSYGVLYDEDRWRRFVEARPASATTAFLVTHSPTTFAGIAAELPTYMSVVRIPDSYLSMFLPDRGRA